MTRLMDRYTDRYNERFYVSPEYTAYDCAAEGSLRISLHAHTLEEAEARFEEFLSQLEGDNEGLILDLQWVAGP